jgi:prepilin-type N-terminal cleavage/methylation domain-containing protein
MNRNTPHAIRRPGWAAGFTLTELLVVIAVIGILAGLIFGAVPKVIERAKITNTRALIHSIDVGLEAFKNDFGRLPYNSSGQVTSDQHLIRLWLLGIKDDGEPDDTGANAVRVNQFWGGPYVDVQYNKHVDKDNDYLFIDAWRQPLCFQMPEDTVKPIFNVDKWDIWSLGPDEKGSTNMTAFQSGTYEQRRKDFKAAADNGDDPGNW